MELNYRAAESGVLPCEIDISSSKDGVYIRRNITKIDTQTELGLVTRYKYQEAFISFSDYESLSKDLLVAKINGEDNSKEFEDYKNKLDTGIRFTNGYYYKPKWISIYSSIIKDFKDVLELYKLAGGDISEYLAIKTNIYDATGKVENAQEMSIKEIIELYLFLYKAKEQYFNEYKEAASKNGTVADSL